MLQSAGNLVKTLEATCIRIIWRRCRLLLLFFALLILTDAVFAEGTIIYVVLPGHLFKTDESWGKSERIPTEGMNVSQPAFSWDGRKIAFIGSAKGKGQPDIYWMDSDGQNIELLTDTPMMDLHPQFSPDGKRLIFTRRKARQKWVTVSLDLSTQKERILFKGFHATYSPDGKWIAFTADDNGNWEVFKTAADRFAPINLSHHRAMDAHPHFSLDGKWIAFSSERHGGPRLLDIYKMRADGSEVTRLTNGLGAELFEAVWSPSGKQILFFDNLHPRQLYRMDSDGKNLKVVAENAGDPAWFDPKWARVFAVSAVGRLAQTWGALKQR